MTDDTFGKSKKQRQLSRRQVLIRLGIATNIIYATPALFEISAAHASEASGPSGGSNSGSSGPSDSGDSSASSATGPSGPTSGPSEATTGPSGTVSGEDARKAVRKKKILSLRKIIRSVEKETGAHVISHRLTLMDKQYIYHLKIKKRLGIVEKIKVDASNASIVSEGLS